MFFTIAATIIATVVATSVIKEFWDKISLWLNKYAGAIVERTFGYEAKDKMQRAIVKVDKLVNKIRQKSTIYVKENPLDDYVLKTDVVAQADLRSFDKEVLKEIEERGVMVQEFKANY